MENRHGTHPYVEEMPDHAALIFHLPSFSSAPEKWRRCVDATGGAGGERRCDRGAAFGATARTRAASFQSHRVAPQGANFLYFLPFLISICLLVSLASGCGAPGEPVPPSPPVPVAVGDLAAQQAGDGVELVFTLPTKSVLGDRLTDTPAVEVMRGALNPDGKADLKSFHVVYTIPGALVGNYFASGRVHFTDPIAPEETKMHPGGNVAYLVRTRVSNKRASSDSNVVTARLFPVPQPISSVQVKVSESAVELSWPTPKQTSAGDPLPLISGYRIYRGEIDPRAPAPTSKEFAQVQWISPLALLGPAATNSYNDMQFDFGKTYVYVIRSVITAEGSEIESDNSEPATMTVLDTFPPAAPQGLVAAVLPGAAPSTFVVDLSWSINVETDLAGYRVYRSEQEGTRGQLITPDLLPVPALRDTSVEPGHHYWYTVTAMDRAGNESAPGNAIAVDVAKPNP